MPPKKVSKAAPTSSDSKEEKKLDHPISLLPAVMKRCPVESAVEALLSTSSFEVLDPRVPTSLTRVFDPTVLTVLRGTFMIDRPYSARLSKCSFLTNGTGLLQVNVATDLTVYAEGAAFLALFDECKLARTRWVLAANAHTTQFPYVIGYEPVVSTSTPTSTNLSRLPCSAICTTFAATLTNGKLTYTAPPESLWGLTAAEGLSSPLIRSGLNGTFSIANVTGCTAPTTAEVSFAYQLITIAHFRRRG
jgi:hypothetical protein